MGLIRQPNHLPHLVQYPIELKMCFGTSKGSGFERTMMSGDVSEREICGMFKPNYPFCCVIPVPHGSVSFALSIGQSGQL